MLSTFNSRLTRTTPRWFVMPVLGAAAGAALISLAFGTGTLPAAFVSATAPAAGCAASHPSTPCPGTAPTFKVPQFPVRNPAPVGQIPTFRQAVAAGSPAQQARMTKLRGELGITPVPAGVPTPSK